jgi:protein tyrosine phosphatase
LRFKPNLTLIFNFHLKYHLLAFLDDDTRVILDTTEGDKVGNDYINGNFVANSIDGYYRYIACQGPSKETVPDFIRMLTQYNIKVVICACNEFEGQKVNLFCTQNKYSDSFAFET